MITEITCDTHLQELELALRDLLKKLQSGYPFRSGFQNYHLRKVIDTCNEMGITYGGELVKNQSEKIS